MPHRTDISEAQSQRLRRLYDEAMTLEAERRLDFVAKACGEDHALRERLVSLLTSERSSSSDSYEHSTWIGAAPASLMDAELPPGHMIGRYRVVKTLGRGGMGVVYLAERADEEFEQRVAIKVVADRAVSTRISARLRSERQILAGLNHPNIARLIDGGTTENGSPFLVMEYVEGERIDDYVKDRELGVRQRLMLFQQVCAAVQYAHTQLVIHRDIKPTNILVTKDGTPKLLDFGIAKLLGANTEIRSTDLTLVHERVMSPEHASPEQVRGDPVTTASDVYALGVLLYILLTDRKPFYFGGASLGQIERAILHETPPKPSAILETPASRTAVISQVISAQELRGDLDTIVMKAMHKDPTQRYQTVAALAEDIANHLASRPIRARPDSLAYRAGKFWRRNRFALVTTAVAAVLLIGMTIFYTLRLAAERDVAERERLTAQRVSQFMTEVFRVANPSETRGNTVPVREVLDAAVQRIREDLGEEPRVRIELMRKMAQAYIGIGLWRSAEALLADAVEHARAALGPQSIELARTLTTLASLHHRRGDFDAARDALREALAIYEVSNGYRDREGVLALLAWAENQVFRTDFDAARATLDRAARLASSLEQEPGVVGELWANYGMLHHLRSEYSQAEHYFRRALPLLEGRTHHGADRYAEIVMSLGEGLIAQGKVDEAVEFLTAHNEELVRIFGATHQVVGDSWNILGIAHCERGEYEICSDAFEKSAEIERLHTPGGSRRLLVRYSNLGSAYYDDGQYEAAVKVLNDALELARTMNSELDPILLAVYYHKAAALRELGRLEAASQALRDAEPVAASYRNKEDRVLASLAIERGRLLSALGKDREAVTVLQDTLRAIAPEERKLQATASLALGSALLAIGRCDEAIERLDAAYRARRELMPETNWFIYEAQSALGEAFSVCGRHEQAEMHLVQSLEYLRKLRRTNDRKLLAAERALAAHRARLRAGL